jgi:hypothetical protein
LIMALLPLVEIADWDCLSATILRAAGDHFSQFGARRPRADGKLFGRDLSSEKRRRPLLNKRRSAAGLAELAAPSDAVDATNNFAVWSLRGLLAPSAPEVSVAAPRHRRITPM